MDLLPRAFAALGRLPPTELYLVLGMIVYWFGFLFIYVVRTAFRGVPRSERFDSMASTRAVPRYLLEYGNWMLKQQVWLLTTLGFSANGVTILSLLAAAGGSVYLAIGRFGLGGWLMFFSFFCDALDGIIARQQGTSSDRGEFFDSVVDRYSDLFISLGFLYYYRNDPIPAAICALALIGSSVMGYARAKGEAVGVDPNVGLMARHERAVYLGIGTVLSPVAAAFIEPEAVHPRYHLALVALTLVAFFTNVTSVWRAAYVVKRMPAAPSSP